MLMIRLNAPLQISRGIFAYGEIIQMYTMRERNYTVIKQPRNLMGAVRRKSITTNGMDAHDGFYAVLPFVD